MKSQSVYWVIRIYKHSTRWWQVLLRTTTLEAPRSPHMHQLAYVWYSLLLEQESGLIPLGHIFKTLWQPAPPWTVRLLFLCRRLTCLTSCEQLFPAWAKSGSWRSFLRGCFLGAGVDLGHPTHRGIKTIYSCVTASQRASSIHYCIIYPPFWVHFLLSDIPGFHPFVWDLDLPFSLIQLDVWLPISE